MVDSCHVQRDRTHDLDGKICLLPLLPGVDSQPISKIINPRSFDRFSFHMIWRLSIVVVATLLACTASANIVDVNTVHRSRQNLSESISKHISLLAEENAVNNGNDHESKSLKEDAGAAVVEDRNSFHKIDVNRHSILQIQLQISSNLTDPVQGSSIDSICNDSREFVNLCKKRWFVQIDELPIGLHLLDQEQIHNKQHVQVHWTCDSTRSSLFGTGFATFLIPLLPHNPAETPSKSSGERTLLAALIEESSEDADGRHRIMLARRLANIPRYEHLVTDHSRRAQENLVVQLELPAKTKLMVAENQENTNKEETKLGFGICTLDIICIASFCASAMMMNFGLRCKGAPAAVGQYNTLEAQSSTHNQNVESIPIPRIAGATRKMYDEGRLSFTTGPTSTLPSPPNYPTFADGEQVHHAENYGTYPNRMPRKLPPVQNSLMTNGDFENDPQYPSLRSPPSLVNRRLTRGEFPFPPAGCGPLLSSYREKIPKPANLPADKGATRSGPTLCRGLFPPSSSSERVNQYKNSEKNLAMKKYKFHTSPRAGASAIEKCFETLQGAATAYEDNEESSLDLQNRQESLCTSKGVTANSEHINQNQNLDTLCKEPTGYAESENQKESEDANVKDSALNELDFQLDCHEMIPASIRPTSENPCIRRSCDVSNGGGLKSVQQIQYGKDKTDDLSNSISYIEETPQDAKVRDLPETGKRCIVAKDSSSGSYELEEHLGSSPIPKCSSVTASPPPEEYNGRLNQLHIDGTGDAGYSKSTLCEKNNTTTSRNKSGKDRIDSRSGTEINLLQRLATGTATAKLSSDQSDDFEFDEGELSPQPGIYVVGIEQVQEHASKRQVRSAKDAFSYVSTLPADNESCSNEKDLSNSSDAAKRIVLDADKYLVTKFTFTVFDQLQACKDGVECKHCYMEMKPFSVPLASSRRLANLPAATRRHLMVACPNVTESFREELRELEELQTREYQKVKPTAQEDFFRLVWDRVQMFSSTGTTALPKKTSINAKREMSTQDADSGYPTPIKTVPKFQSDELLEGRGYKEKYNKEEFNSIRSPLQARFRQKRKKKRAPTFVPDVIPSTSLVSASHEISEPPVWEFGQGPTGQDVPRLVTTANDLKLKGKNRYSSKKRRLN